MKKLWCVLMAITLAGLAPGCRSQDDRPAVMMQSRALRATVIDVLEEAMARRAAAGEPLPASAADDPWFNRSVADTILEQFPSAFEVTTVQEQAFQQGRFPEDHQAERRSELAQLLKAAEQRGTRFNTIAFELLQQHAQQPLEGIRLELLVRLLRASV